MNESERVSLVYRERKHNAKAGVEERQTRVEREREKGRERQV